MSVILECKKTKRTGFVPAMIGGGILAAVIPVLNMLVRADNYIYMTQTPAQILLEANWQMMAMLNVLLIVAGTCMIYHTEYADNAIQRMNTLPVGEGRMFGAKFILMVLMSMAVLIIEAAAFLFCIWHWFQGCIKNTGGGAGGIFDNGMFDLCKDIFRDMGYSFLLLIPAILLSLLIANVCKNMWITLGIDVVCVFVATMLPVENFVLSLFPFAMPFQILEGTAADRAIQYMIAAAIESVIIGIAELIFIKVRRVFE